MVMLIYIIAIGALMYALWRLRGTLAAIVLAVAMGLAFPAYNSTVMARCEGGCDIRVDLLIILPLLIFAALIAAWSLVSLLRKR
jgi:hypothetical protein